MKEFEERTCKICGMKFKTKDGRVKTCHRHKKRYNESMKKSSKAEPKTLTEVVENQYKVYKREKREKIIVKVIHCVNLILDLAILVAIVVK